MDIFNSRYFIINKILLKSVGLWPYQSYKQKYCLRIFLLTILLLIVLPQIIRVYKYFGVNIDIIIEHIAVIIYMSAMALKIVTSIVTEDKLKTVYENVAQNWESIKREDERKILIKYSERGRLLTLGYIVYMFCALVSFVTMPLTPMILDIINPLNVSRPRIFVLGGEFKNREANYGRIYLFDFISCIVAALIISSVDSMYAACIEHCLGLFAIIKFRLRSSNKNYYEECNTPKMKRRDVSYNFIVETIRIHKKTILFTDILESSYSSSFLFLMGLNMMILSFESVLVLIKLDQVMEFIRFSFILFGIIVHLFYISWPGQKLTDYSLGICEDAYVNDWYEYSVPAQKLLGFMALRSARPCQLTAGGIYVMNFVNFASIVKTSISYMTLFASLR